MGSLDMDNVLVHQKNTILELVQRKSLDDIRIALRELELLRELWCVENYHYKGKELCSIAQHTLSDLYGDTRNWKRRKLIAELTTKATELWRLYWEAECAWKGQ